MALAKALEVAFKDNNPLEELWLVLYPNSDSGAKALAEAFVAALQTSCTLKRLSLSPFTHMHFATPNNVNEITVKWIYGALKGNPLQRATYDKNNIAYTAPQSFMPPPQQ